MFRNTAFFYFLLFFHIGCQSIQEKTIEHSHFQLFADINPVSQTILIEGTLDLFIRDSVSSELSFRIHRQLNIDYFSVANIDTFEVDTSGATFSPFSRELKFRLLQPVKAGEIIPVKFKYQGKITEWPKWGANIIDPEWVELGLYFPWFPNGSGSLPASYDLKIDCPEEYQVFSIGKINKLDNAWQIIQNEPINDVVIFISKDMNIVKNHLSDLQLTLCHHNLSDTILKSFSIDIDIAYRHFSNWFGSLENPNLTIVESKREVGGGYARTGMIVLPSFKNMDYFSNRIMYNTYIGHEMAHLWWNKAAADSWEDWLNESFAEYSSLLIVREVFGSQEFEKQLLSRQENIKDLKPIWGISRTDSQAYYVLYHKGAILLYELETKIGEQEFQRLVQLYHQNNIKTTKEFLSLLGKQEGETISSWFEEMLKTM